MLHIPPADDDDAFIPSPPSPTRLNRERKPIRRQWMLAAEWKWKFVCGLSGYIGTSVFSGSTSTHSSTSLVIRHHRNANNSQIDIIFANPDQAGSSGWKDGCVGISRLGCLFYSLSDYFDKDQHACGWIRKEKNAAINCLPNKMKWNRFAFASIANIFTSFKSIEKATRFDILGGFIQCCPRIGRSVSRRYFRDTEERLLGQWYRVWLFEYNKPNPRINNQDEE